MQSMRLCYLGLALALVGLECLEAAPSPAKQKQAKPEHLVRVYPISEDQYESLLKLTDGKHVISEGRLTSAGFTAVRNTLDSGWHNLLRIIGLTATHSEQPEVKVDGQPLCVMRRSYATSEPDSQPRSQTVGAASDEEQVINCIVVLKRDSPAKNPHFTPYWYYGQQEQKQLQESQSLEKPLDAQQTDPKQQDQDQQQPQQPQQQEPEPEPEQQDPDQEGDLRAVRGPTGAPKSPKASRRRKHAKSKKAKRVPAYMPLPLGRQYGPPPSPYGSAFGGTYPYGGYGQTPYSPYSPFPSPYGPQQPFAPPSAGFGPASSFGQQPYPFAPPFYGQGQGFNPYPYFEQGDTESGEEEYDGDADHNLEADVDLDSSSDEEYYD